MTDNTTRAMSINKKQLNEESAKLSSFRNVTTDPKSINNTPRPRIHSKDILPMAIKKRLLGDIIARADVTQTTVSGLNNGDQIINQLLIVNEFDRRIMGTTERATYVGSVSNDNLLPGGTAVDESQWQVIGPFNAVIKTNGSAVDGNELANQLYVRNISAGASQTLIFRDTIRFIMNEGGISSAS